VFTLYLRRHTMHIIRSLLSTTQGPFAFTIRLASSLGIVSLLAACADIPLSPSTDVRSPMSSSSSTSSGDVVFLAGNPSCASLGYLGGIKVESPVSESSVTSGPVTFTFESPTMIESWESTIPIDAVIMKAGNGALIFSHAGGANSGSGEFTPTTDGGQQLDIGHVAFCYYGRFAASIEGDGLYTREYAWDIAKTASAPATVTRGSSLVVDYVVTTSRSWTDHDFIVEGSALVSNSGYGASGVVQGVSVDISGSSAEVTCNTVTFPKTLADGESFACDYSLSVPDANARLETWTVSVDEAGGWRTKTFLDPVTFGDPTSLVDDVVTLFDTRVPDGLGTFTAPGSVPYSVTYGPYDVCTPVEIDNMASFISNTNEKIGASSASVTVDITGCLTDEDISGAAFAYSGDPATSFSALGISARWGWTIDFGAPSSKTYDVYVGAGRNELSKGANVGTVTITYTGSTVTASYNLLSGYSVAEQHLYAGSTMAPTLESGKKTITTVAPGQYSVSVSGGHVWVIAYSVIGYTQP